MSVLNVLSLVIISFLCTLHTAHSAQASSSHSVHACDDTPAVDQGEDPFKNMSNSEFLGVLWAMRVGSLEEQLESIRNQVRRTMQMAEQHMRQASNEEAMQHVERQLLGVLHSSQQRMRAMAQDVRRRREGNGGWCILPDVRPNEWVLASQLAFAEHVEGSVQLFEEFMGEIRAGRMRESLAGAVSCGEEPPTTETHQIAVVATPAPAPQLHFFNFLAPQQEEHSQAQPRSASQQPAKRRRQEDSLGVESGRMSGLRRCLILLYSRCSTRRSPPLAMPSSSSRT